MVTLNVTNITGNECDYAKKACDYAYRVFTKRDATPYEKIHALTMLARASGRTEVART